MSLASESDSGAFIARRPPITSFITSSTLIRRARCCGTIKSLRTHESRLSSRQGASVDCVSVAAAHPRRRGVGSPSDDSLPASSGSGSGAFFSEMPCVIELSSSALRRPPHPIRFRHEKRERKGSDAHRPPPDLACGSAFFRPSAKTHIQRLRSPVAASKAGPGGLGAHAWRSRRRRWQQAP